LRRASTRQIRTARRCTCTSVALLLLAGCGAAKRALAYEDLTAKVGGLEFTHITVDTSRSRDELLGVLERNNPGLRIRLPQIDYANHETFVVAAGPRSSTGYSLRVVDVYEHGDHVQVVIRERTPSLGEPVHARVTYPFRLLVLPSRKPVHLKWLGRP
jgi:PrcB C-terminal